MISAKKAAIRPAPLYCHPLGGSLQFTGSAAASLMALDATGSAWLVALVLVLVFCTWAEIRTGNR
jgi:hypothetical protein